jgi:hypothetical protein
MAVDNSCSSEIIEESERPPLTSYSEKGSLAEQKKRANYLLQNRTILFVDNTNEIRVSG